MQNSIVLSHIQIEPILAARQKGQQSIEVSPDLGLSRVTVTLTPEGVIFPNGEQLSWQNIEKIKKSQANCFLLEDGRIKAIQVFSEETNRVCSLLPAVLLYNSSKVKPCQRFMRGKLSMNASEAMWKSIPRGPGADWRQRTRSR